MLHSYLKGAKLRAYLSQPDCPPALHECKALLDQAYGVHGTQNTAVDPLEEVIRPSDRARAVNVPPELRELVPQSKTVLRAHLRHAGVVYSRSSTNIGNSQILFYPCGDRSLSPIPGVIQHIYEVEGCMAFAVQRRRTSAADVFAAYPHFPAKLYSTQLMENLEHVKVSWVMSHYASWAVSPREVVVLSLCQVCTPAALKF